MEKDDKLTEIRNFFLLTLSKAAKSSRLLMLEAQEAEVGS